MASFHAHGLFEEYQAALAYVRTRDVEGNEGIGSAFHLGEGVFVTARHVIESRTVLEVATTNRGRIELEGEEATQAKSFLNSEGRDIPIHTISPAKLAIAAGPFFHSDPAVDIAVFRVDAIDPRTPVARLGSHLDDWVGEADFVLSQVLILGYPPIPMTREPFLVAARGEVNAVVDVLNAPHLHFVISAMPRGGFSGGLVLSEYGYVLGIVTRSLLLDEQPAELGYMTALTVEPIYQCLAEAKLLPGVQAEGWDDFWNTDRLYTYGVRQGANELRVTAEVEIFDDGRRQHIDVISKDEALRDMAIRAAVAALAPLPTTKAPSPFPSAERIVVGDGRLGLGPSLAAAAAAAARVFEEAGLVSRDTLRIPSSR